ncbi:MAG TPA: hypothetical protein VGP93_19850 [Polyangiaceae bacterium]|nr:hypothetical protein [Polyangiaceae bacterium]
MGGAAAGGASGNGGKDGSTGVGGQSGGAGTSSTVGGGGAGGSMNAGGTGNSASGGGGNGGAPVVTACDDLGTVGTWENVEPAQFHSPSNMQTIAVAVNPSDQSVFAAASNKTNGGDGSTGIYKSTDCGATWTQWNTGAGQANLATGQLWAMLIDPSQPQNMYVANGYGNGPTIYKSSNGGVDFVPLQTDPTDQVGFVQAIALDPSNPSHVAVTYHQNCSSPYNDNCLSSSTDAGETWELFNGPSEVGGWQEAASLSVLGPDSYIYAYGGGVYFTSNGGTSWTKVMEGIFGRYAGSTDLAPDGSLYLADFQGIWQSTEDLGAGNPLGKSWSLLEGSPHPVTNLIDDGIRIFGVTIDGPPFFAASLDAPTVWTHLDSPGVTSGSNEMAYDATHHVVYSANFTSGLLRLVTR